MAAGVVLSGPGCEPLLPKAGAAVTCPRPLRARRRTFLFLHPDRIEEDLEGSALHRGACTFQVFIIALVALNLALVLFAAAPARSNPAGSVCLVGAVAAVLASYLSCAVFTAEYVARLWSCPEHHPDASPWALRRQWFGTYLSLLELAALALMWASLLQSAHAGSAVIARSVRAGKVLRVLQVTRGLDVTQVLSSSSLGVGLVSKITRAKWLFRTSTKLHACGRALVGPACVEEGEEVDTTGCRTLSVASEPPTRGCGGPRRHRGHQLAGRAAGAWRWPTVEAGPRAAGALPGHPGSAQRSPACVTAASSESNDNYPFLDDETPPAKPQAAPLLFVGRTTTSPRAAAALLDEHCHPEDLYLTFCSTASVAPSSQRPDVFVVRRRMRLVREMVATETSGWPGAQAREGQATSLRVLDLLQDPHGGGALVAVAPFSEFSKLEMKCTDGGYLTRRLKDVHVSSPEFRRVLREFAAHSDTDRWPEDYKDRWARGHPKDGAILIAANGYRAKCAAKILRIMAPCEWPDHGTRHEAALFIASQLSHAVVFIRSDGGGLHCLLASDAGRKALEVEGFGVVALGPRGPPAAEEAPPLPPPPLPLPKAAEPAACAEGGSTGGDLAEAQRKRCR